MSWSPLQIHRWTVSQGKTRSWQVPQTQPGTCTEKKYRCAGCKGGTQRKTLKQKVQLMNIKQERREHDVARQTESGWVNTRTTSALMCGDRSLQKCYTQDSLYMSQQLWWADTEEQPHSDTSVITWSSLTVLLKRQQSGTTLFLGYTITTCQL